MGEKSATVKPLICGWGEGVGVTRRPFPALFVRGEKPGRGRKWGRATPWAVHARSPSDLCALNHRRAHAQACLVAQS